jgi:hypothetical protein
MSTTILILINVFLSLAVVSTIVGGCLIAIRLDSRWQRTTGRVRDRAPARRTSPGRPAYATMALAATATNRSAR